MIKLLKKISESGIVIDIKDGKLELFSSNTDIESSLIEEIKANKEALISYLSKHQSSSINKVAYQEIPKCKPSIDYPLSNAQLRLWITSQMKEGSILFNMPRSIVLEGNYEVTKFENAIQAVIERHEILRTVFKLTESGEVRQSILTPQSLKFKLNYKDFRKDQNGEVKAEAYIASDAHIPFDLENGPLLRASLIQVSDEKYIFYYNMHHIISDGRSMEILTRDVMAYYESYISGNEAELPSLLIQYKDYASWQLEELRGPSFQGHKKYWLNRMTGEIPTIDLPSYKTRPAFKSPNGKSLTTYFSESLTDKIKSFIHQKEGSLFSVVLSALNILIYKYTLNEDIVIGFPSTDRMHSDLEDQIGFYVNTLPFRHQINPTENFSDFHNSVKNEVLEDLSHQQYPFDKIIEDLTYKYDQSRSPIFDISLTIHNEIKSKIAKVEDRIVEQGDTVCRNDMEFHFTQFENVVSFQVAFNKDVYDGEMVSNLMDHFKQMLELILEQPNIAIDEVSFLRTEEIQEQLRLFNATEKKYPEEQTVIDLFEEHARNRPDAIALVYDEEVLTYKELDERSNRLANCLRQDYNIQKGAIIGLHLDRSAEYIVCLLGIMKSGGVYLPIDTKYPQDRKEYIIHDAGVNLLLSDTNYMFDFDFFDGTLIAIDVEFDAANYSSKNEHKVDAQDLAYVIYTSGSTGNPKGVLIEHKGIANTARAQLDTFSISPDQRTLQFSSYSFDASVFEVFMAFGAGASLYVASEEMRTDPEVLGQYLVDNNISVATLTPSFFQMIDPKYLKHFKVMITAGESPDFEKVSAYLALGGNYYNAYGPTETSVWASTFAMTKNTVLETNNIPIGVPVYNADLYILDENNQLCPKGTIGEISIGGKGLAKGYLNKPELTQKKFIKHPFIKGERLYKTGDLGRWLPDGNMEFKGRKDFQVKIRGHRIELEEIESTINKIKLVQQSIVLAREDGDSGKQLVAYITGNSTIDPGTIEKELMEKLPEYMVPRIYVFLDEMPLTRNGKIDRKALPAPEGKAYNKKEYVAPQSKEEKLLVSISEVVLGVEKIGIKDNFYNLGGDSIKSIQIVSRLRQKGYTLSVGEIMSNPIFEELALLITEMNRSIDQSEVKGEVLLTPIQHYLFKDAGVSKLHHYNQSVLLKSHEPLDHEVLKSIFTAIISHHDALRMTFQLEEGNWKQHNGPIDDSFVRIDYHDLRMESNAVEKMEETCQMMQSSINLEQGPLFLVGHFRLEDGDRIAMICHHLVIDGVSWRIILEDLSSLFQQFKKGEDYELPAKTDSFQTWAALLNEFAQNKTLEKELNYWNSIENQFIPDFPVDKGNANEITHYDNRLTFSLDEETTSLMQTSVHSVYHTEINDVLLAGLGLAIQDVFGIYRTIIHMEGHGREEILTDVDVSRTVGWFTSFYPFLLEVSDSSDRAESLVKVKDALRSIPNKGVGFSILKYLAKTIQGNRPPAIMFNYLGDFGANSDDQNKKGLFEYGTENIGENIGGAVKRTPLSVSGIMSAGKLNISISFSSENYTQDQIKQLVNKYKEHLEILIKELSETNASYLTTSDLTFTDLTFDEIHSLNEAGQLEDVYELSPAQEGMYYHWMSEENFYFEQVSYRLKWPKLNLENVKIAYDQLVDRYAILRTSFSADYGGQLLQIVKKQVPSGFFHQKIPANIGESINSWVDQMKVQDREQGFNLENGSQMRLTVLELGNDEYVFIWSHHHILMDGWCSSILINDFYRILQSVNNNLKTVLPPAKPYSAYINWLGRVDEDESLAYWRDYLSGYNSVVKVPFETMDSTEDQYEEGIQTIEFKESSHEKIINLCNDLGITPNTFIETAWGYLLSRYNDTKDVVFGSIVSGRPGEIEGIEDMVGLFINTIPVRIQYKEKDSLSDLLVRAQNLSIEGLPHHYVSLATLQGQSELGTSLLDHIIVFENFPIQELIEDQLEGKVEESSVVTLMEPVDVNEKTNYHFNLKVGVKENSLSVHFQFNKNKFEEKQVARIAAHFENVVTSFVQSPSKPLQEVDYLTDQEKIEQLETFNATQFEFPKGKTMIDIFREKSKESPDKAAVIFDDELITYQDLEKRSNKLANCLVKDYGVKKGDFVGMHLDRGAQYIVCLLGILKVGAVYLPIDTKYPSDRKKYIIEDANVQLLIINDKYAADLTYHKGRFLKLDTSYEHNQYGDEFDLNIVPSDLAYVIYTSGSTGRPKGVLIEHKGITNTILAQIDYFGLSADQRGLQFASFSFDASVSEIFIVLLAGATLYIADDEMRNDPSLLEKYIVDHGINVATIPPTFFQLMNPESLSGFQVLITAGESPDYNKAIAYLEYGKSYFNAYGPTETSICASMFKMTVDSELDGTAIPIGQPIANGTIYILDDNHNLKPKGAIGEICVGGLGLAKGYLNRPALTKEKFIDHPFILGERLYKTGDLGRWLDDGNIEFKGRKDHQVKIRGHRVELEEIETVLSKIKDLEQSVVIARTDKQGAYQLVAYLVGNEGWDQSKVQSILANKLPDFMVPRIYVSLEKMPLTPNGKIDRKALPEPDVSRYTQQDFVAPTTKEEQVLVAICESVLGVKKIGIKDNFYNLGGDSIKSILVVSRLRQQGYTLNVADVLASPILEDLAKLLKKVTRSIDQSEVVGEVMLTPPQRFLFQDSGLSKLHHFNQSVLLKSNQLLDRNTLQSCVTELVKHHDVLRMAFRKEGNNWQQINLGFSDQLVRIDFHDLSSESDGLEKMGNLCQELQSGFDLAQGPLFVVGHFRLSDGDQLALICHHLIIDGISWRIIMEDLSTLYQQYKEGAKIKLPPKTDSYQSWATSLYDYAQSNSLIKERSYWESIQTKDIPEFPLDKAAKREVKFLDKRLSFTLDRDLTSVMQTGIHNVYHTEINDLLLTGLGLAIKNVFGINRTVVNMEGHGREEIIEEVDISRTVGWFSGVHPFVLEVSDASNRSRSLIMVKDALRKIPNKGIGYSIIKYLTEGFKTKVNPTIMFNYLGDFGAKAGVTDQSSIFEYGSDYIGNNLGEETTKEILFSVSGMMVGGALNMSISYSSELFNEESVLGLIDAYKQNLVLLIKELLMMEGSYLTPSDLTYSDISFEGLQKLNTDGLLEDVYILSPSQEGMHYHWLSDNSFYFEQICYRIKASGLNIDYVREAYDALVNRYGVLRTSFTSQYEGKLLQVVKKSVPSRFIYEKRPDGLVKEDLKNWIEEKKFADNSLGFNLEEPSQMRMTILDLENGEYEFIWSLHHIIMDGWCAGILLNDFYTILRSIDAGVKWKLPDPTPYSEYIKWLSNVDEEKTLSYWKKYLSGYDTAVKVPFNKLNRDNVNRGEDKIEFIELGGDLYQKISALCNDIGITPNTFIEVAWGYLLSRYNNTKDAVFGAVVSGRPADLEGVEGMVGVFLNTIPVRIKYEGTDRLRNVLKKTQENSIAGISHHYVSLAKVQGESELGMNLLDHILVFENFPIQEQLEEQLEESTLNLESESVEVKEKINYDFNVTIGVSATSLRVYFQYNTNKYDQQQIRKLANHFHNVSTAFVQQPDQRLSSIEFLAPEEKVEILEEFKGAINSSNSTQLVMEQFVNQSIKTPDSIALKYENQQLTYSELNKASDRLAIALRDVGVCNGTLVPLFIDRSFDMIIGILGILKAGGTYVPIDTTYPTPRIQHILEDTKAELVLTQKSLANRINSISKTISTAFVDEDLPLEFKDKLDNIKRLEIDPNQLMYIIYTSGTTGVPKGVMISHLAASDYVNTFKDYFHLSETDQVLQQASISFDTSIEEIFPILVSGGCLCLGSTINDFEDLIQTCEQEGVTILSTHPYLIQYLNETISERDLSLRVLISGGDVLKKEYLTRLFGKFDIYNTYGPTESTVCASYHKVEEGEELISIGRPVSNREILILNEDLGLQPVGVIGELCIGGNGLANGYLNSPDLTLKKFINHPFKEGARLYRTGDLARWLPNGTIEFIGRKDEQVSINGYRIELGEIESALNQLGSIVESLVTVTQEKNDTKQLVAYLVAENKPKSSSLREALQKQLPDYMVPNFFIQLEKIPLTPNGKIDYKKLPAPIITNEKGYIPATSKTEIRLVEIWQEILGIERVGIEDNFFELGGNSLIAVKIALRIRKELDLSLDIKSLFDHKTISSLALQIDFILQQEAIKSNSKVVKQIL